MPGPKGSRPASHRIHMSRALPTLAVDLNLFAEQTLKIAVYSDFFPVAYKDPKTRQLRGLDVDIIEGFCRAVKLKPKYVPIKSFFDAWESPGRWDQHVDVTIGGVGRSPWRDSQSVEWTVPYFKVRRTVVFNLKDPIHKFPEDVHRTIVGVMGSTGFNDAANRMYDAGKGDLLEDREGSDARDLRELLSGKIQGMMRGSFVGQALVAKHPRKLGMTEPWDIPAQLAGPGGDEVFAFPCRRGSGLAGQLGLYLLHISMNGTLARLIRKHKM